MTFDEWWAKNRTASGAKIHEICAAQAWHYQQAEIERLRRDNQYALNMNREQASEIGRLHGRIAELEARIEELEEGIRTHHTEIRKTCSDGGPDQRLWALLSGGDQGSSIGWVRAGLQMARHELQSTKRSRHMKKIIAVLLIAAAMPAVAEVRCKPFPWTEPGPAPIIIFEGLMCPMGYIKA